MEEDIKNAIISLIKNNIDTYMFSDIYFIELKQFLKDNCDKDLSNLISHDLIIKFTKEIMTDLLLVPYLYDFS